jgi:hypothetical protein
MELLAQKDSIPIRRGDMSGLYLQDSLKDLSTPFGFL